MLGWHFLSDSGKLRDGTEPPADGVPLIHTGEIVICRSGLHASRRLIDALFYAPGGVLCRVECDDIAAEQGDKLVCHKRTILWRMDVTRVLHDFALWCAEDALSRVENPDPRSLAALEVKRLWLDGKATDAELRAARAEAAAAAWAAPRAAAEAEAARAAAWAATWAAEAEAARAAQNDRLEAMVLQAREGAAKEESDGYK